jgi:hypothetical protein
MNDSKPDDQAPVDDFMLKEYESIASAHFDSQAGLRQQFRFYLIIAAVPVTIIGIAFKDRPIHEIAQLTFFNLPVVLTSVFFAIGVLGFLLLLSMIHTALDATMYARTVNGVRQYFVDRADGLDTDIRQYLVMPFDKKRPKYFHIRSFFWQVTLIAAVNTFYVTLFIRSILHCTSGFAITCAIIFLAQIGIYPLFTYQREKKELSG